MASSAVESIGADVVQDSVSALEQHLDRVNGGTQLTDLDRKLIDDGRRAGSKLMTEGVDASLSASEEVALEAIAIADGSRPALLLRGDTYDPEDPTIGDWGAKLPPLAEALRTAASGVGRIDLNGRHCGTGWLLRPGYVVTNRHVAQALARAAMDSTLTLDPARAATISFGHQLGEQAPPSVHAIDSILYAGPDYIDPQRSDLARLDFAILKLRAVAGRTLPEPLPTLLLPIDATLPGREIFVLGYPGPAAASRLPDSVLLKLLGSQAGLKRLSPGEIAVGVNQLDGDRLKRVAAHDATTLGGSSGSTILAFDDANNPLVVGLHFGGYEVKYGPGGVVEYRRRNFAHSFAAMEDVIAAVDAAVAGDLGAERGRITAVGRLPDTRTREGGALPERTTRAGRSGAQEAHNAAFLRRLFARRPDARAHYAATLAQSEAVAEAVMDRAAGGPERTHTDYPVVVAETIVRRERPVLFVKGDWLDFDDVAQVGVEAKDLVDGVRGQEAILRPLMPLIGRIDVGFFPNTEYLGTGWFVDTDIVVTNRHVASLMARQDGGRYVFRQGVAGKSITSSLSTLHESEDEVADSRREFLVEEILYIEKETGPDIAFLKVKRSTDGTQPSRITVAAEDATTDKPVLVVGYPARASKRLIPDQDLMEELFRRRYDVKRCAVGLSLRPDARAMLHDCTTLGGNSGSVVLDPGTGQAVGLHFAGLYQEENYAVPASVLMAYISRRNWISRAPEVVTQGREARTPPPRPVPPKNTSPNSRTQAGAVQAGAVTVTIPLSITLTFGDHEALADAASPGAADAQPDLASVEAAVRAFWKERPEGVIAARVGFEEEEDRIGDRPLIAASVSGDRLAEVAARGPAAFRGLAVRYLSANAAEQIDALVTAESVESISYDDAARTGPEFSFDPVCEPMMIRAHVGPEYSWDELSRFLSEARGTLVSGIYEFHAPQIADAIAARLDDGLSFTMVCDNATYAEVANPSEEFDRVETFARWQQNHGDRFQRVTAPEGTAGLISDAYHIKVTVREDDTLWLSSGNWKQGSSQPVITQQERDAAATVDLPGNREWHVIIRNTTLATRFRQHILQDFRRSRDLGAGALPRSREAPDILVDVAVEEGVELERRPASQLLRPLVIDRVVKVRPLLTPDRDGAVYSDAVLNLIRSARRSLLFQIPYIGMPSNPRVDRGYIDALIEALTQKLLTLDDARVILRSGGSRFSAPTHAAWYFKSKGVDIDAQLRQIENHHTKGMIVDGRRVLIGSHNWSKPGVTLNRDASLIFDDSEIAEYFASAFELDWERASKIAPRRFAKRETIIRDATGIVPPPGLRRIRLSELMRED